MPITYMGSMLILSIVKSLKIKGTWKSLSTGELQQFGLDHFQ